MEKKILGITIALMILAMIGATLTNSLQQNKTVGRHTEDIFGFELSWEVESNEDDQVKYEPFGNNVLRYTNNGASYIDQSGKTIWTVSYEMKAPTAVVNDDYAVIADMQGKRLFICNIDGCQGEASTALPINKVTVSMNGIVATVLEEATSSYIHFFNKDGKALDIIIKSTISGNGYPTDISLSDDGSRLMCLFEYIRDSEKQNRVCFYDFSEFGTNVPNRIVGSFEEPFKENKIVLIQHLAEPYSCAFAVNNLTFFSSENADSPELIAQVPIEDEIQSTFYSDDYAGIILKNNDGEFASQLRLYHNDGSLVMTRDFTYGYSQVYIDDNIIILNNEDSCRIYDTSGEERLSAEFDFSVSRIRKGSLPDTYIVSGLQAMKEVKIGQE